MADSPTYLPVHSLPENTSPAISDYIVWQASGNTGDVGLLTASNFVTAFADYLIDSSTTTAFLAAGWVAPT